MPKIVGYVGETPPTQEHGFPWMALAVVGAGTTALLWIASKVGDGLVANAGDPMEGDAKQRKKDYIGDLTEEQIAEGKRRYRGRRVSEFTPDMLAKITAAIDAARKGDPAALPPESLTKEMESLGVMSDLARLPPGRYTFDLDPKFPERRRKWSRNRWRRYKDSTSLRGAFHSASRAADGSDSRHVFVDTKGAPTGLPDAPYTAAAPVVLGLYREDGAPVFLIYATNTKAEPFIEGKEDRARDRVVRETIRQGRMERTIYGMMSSGTRQALAEEKRRLRNLAKIEREEEAERAKKRRLEKVGEQIVKQVRGQLEPVIEAAKEVRKETAKEAQELKKAAGDLGKAVKSATPAPEKPAAAPKEKKPRTSKAAPKELKAPKTPPSKSVLKTQLVPSSEVGEGEVGVSPDFIQWFSSTVKELGKLGINFPPNTLEGTIISDPVKVKDEDRSLSTIELTPVTSIAVDSSILASLGALKTDRVAIKVRYDGSIPVEVAYEKLRTGVSSREARNFLKKFANLPTSLEMKDTINKLMLDPKTASIAKSILPEAQQLINAKRAEEAALRAGQGAPAPAPALAPAAATTPTQPPVFEMVPQAPTEKATAYAQRVIDKAWLAFIKKKLDEYVKEIGVPAKSIKTLRLTKDSIDLSGTIVGAPFKGSKGETIIDYGFHQMQVGRAFFDPGGASRGDTLRIRAKIENDEPKGVVVTWYKKSAKSGQGAPPVQKNSAASDRDPALFREFRRTINMSAAEIERWRRNPQHRDASLPHIRAELPLLAQMKRTPVSKWTPRMWNKAMRAVNFVKRHEAQMKVQAKRYGTGRLHATYKRIIGLPNWGRKTPGVNIKKVLGSKSSKGKRTSKNPARVSVRRTSRARKTSRHLSANLSVMRWM